MNDEQLEVGRLLFEFKGIVEKYESYEEEVKFNKVVQSFSPNYDIAGKI